MEKAKVQQKTKECFVEFECKITKIMVLTFCAEIANNAQFFVS